MFARWPSLRTLFAGLYLALQALLVGSAGRRVNHSFGFRMFEESSTLELHVERLLDDGLSLPIEDEWRARDCAGVEHWLRWSQLVRFPAPQRLDEKLTQPYGVDSGLALSRAALAFVAAHTPEDCQTLAFVATARLIRNGRALPPVSFTVRR